MSYCVNCGVELDDTARFCPLCHTPVLNPSQPVNISAPPPFPDERGEVPPAVKRDAAILLSSMLVSVAVCCGVLNMFLKPERTWSVYVIGAAVMLWLWLVPPLLDRGMHVLLRLLVDVLAVALYVLFIALNLDGWTWYMGLALPIILWGGALLLLLGLTLWVKRRSLLTTVTVLIGSVGVFLLGVELLIDRFLNQNWEPGWSLVVLTVCAGLVIPLLVVRRVPSLREEARRRFHM